MMNVKMPPYVTSRLNSAINQGEITGVRYGFPTATHPTDIVRNCATAFDMCGLTLPAETGELKYYIPALAKKGTQVK